MKKSVLAVCMLLCLAGCQKQASTVQNHLDETVAELSWQEQYELGMRYLLEGNYEEAILAFTKAIEIEPKEAKIYVARGNAYYGKLQQSDTLEGAAGADNLDGIALAEGSEEFEAGLARESGLIVLTGEQLELFQNAERDYLEAIGLDKTIVEAYDKLADLYIGVGDIEKAIEILKQGYKNTNEERLQERAKALEALPDISVKFRGKSITVSMYGAQNGFVGHDFYAFDTKGRMIANIWYNEDNGVEYQETWIYDETAGKTYSTVYNQQELYEEWEDEEWIEEQEEFPGDMEDYQEEFMEEGSRKTGTVELEGCEDHGWYWESMGDENEEIIIDENFSPEEYVFREFITDPTMAHSGGRVEWTDGRYGIYSYDSQERVSTIYTYESTGELLGYCVVTYSN